MVNLHEYTGNQGRNAWMGTVTISCSRGRREMSLAVNMHAVVLQSLSLGLNKNARLNKRHWAERLNWAKPPNCLHLLNFTSHGPGGTVYPSDILRMSFRQIWMHAPVCLKWNSKAPSISSLMDWNKASGAHWHRISSLYLDQLQISTTATKRIPDMGRSGQRRSSSQHRWWYGWLNLTHTARRQQHVVVCTLISKTLNLDTKVRWWQKNQSFISATWS